MQDLLFGLIFITGIVIFVLLLVSPIILIYLLGSNPKWQDNIRDFFKAKKKEIIITVMVIACLCYIHMAISAYKENGLEIFILSAIQTFIKYALLSFVWFIIIFICKQIKKLFKKDVNTDDNNE